MRQILVALLIFSIDYLAFKSLRTATLDWSNLSKNILYGLHWSIPIITFVLFGIFTFHTRVSDKQNIWDTVRFLLIILYVGKVITIGFYGFDTLRMLTTQLFRPEYNPARSKFLAQLGILAGAMPMAVLSYGVIRNAYRYKIWRKTLHFAQLPADFEGLKIVQISDIHSGSFKDKAAVQKGINLINEQKPDVVFFTGDLVNVKANEMDAFVDVFKGIEAKYGVYSITGNHDYGDYAHWESRAAKAANFQALIQQHKNLGWDLLLNEHRILTINDVKIGIIGVENYSALPQFPKYGKLDEAYANMPEDTALKILLSHDPTHWDVEVRPQYQDIDLTLSGHTHGFQFGIEIPGWLRWSPSRYIYRQWAGLYQSGKQYLYVNRGFGFLGYPGRVGILPEITVLELRGGQQS